MPCRPLAHQKQATPSQVCLGLSDSPKHNSVAKAINHMFEEDGRWETFTRFLDDGRICLTNDAAERALRGIALGRKPGSWLDHHGAATELLSCIP